MPHVDSFYPEPSFTINEALAPDINGFKEGQKIRAMISYKVIEKTKSFAGLKIGSMMLKPTARILT